MRRINTLGWSWRLAVTPPGAGIALAGLGLVVWSGLSVWAGFATTELSFRLREAWDCPAYFYVGLPLMVSAVAIAGFIRPERAWRWPLWLVAGHQAGVLLVGLGMQSELSLLILTLILAIILAGFFAIPAMLASLAARRLGARAY